MSKARQSRNEFFLVSQFFVSVFWFAPPRGLASADRSSETLRSSVAGSRSRDRARGEKGCVARASRGRASLSDLGRRREKATFFSPSLFARFGRSRLSFVERVFQTPPEMPRSTDPGPSDEEEEGKGSPHASAGGGAGGEAQDATRAVAGGDDNGTTESDPDSKSTNGSPRTSSSTLSSSPPSSDPGSDSEREGGPASSAAEPEEGFTRHTLTWDSDTVERGVELTCTGETIPALKKAAERGEATRKTT